MFHILNISNTLKNKSFKYTLFKICIHIFVILLFTIINYVMKNEHYRDGSHDGFDTNLNFNDIFYYTIITHSAVGYGDIVPYTKKGRMITTIHVFILIILLISL